MLALRRRTWAVAAGAPDARLPTYAATALTPGVARR